MTVALPEVKDLRTWFRTAGEPLLSLCTALKVRRLQVRNLPCRQGGARSTIRPKGRPVDAIETCLPTTYSI